MNSDIMKSDSVSLLPTDPEFVNRCVKYQQPYNERKAATNVKSFPIEKMVDIREQEAVIIKDLLYVLGGLEGFYIRYSESFNQEDISRRLVGPDFVIHRQLDAGLKGITKRLVKLGTYYYALDSFTNIYDNITYGQTMQALCYEIRALLKEYNLYLVQIELQFTTNPAYSLSLLEGDLTESIAAQLYHSYEIIQQINQENLKRQDSDVLQDMRFNNVMNGLKNDIYTGSINNIPSDSQNSKYVKGITVLRLIQITLDNNRGNTVSYNFLLTFFNNISKSFIAMLNDWLRIGVINDPYDEFIIKQQTIKKDDYIKYSESFWLDRFALKNNDLMLKQFDSKAIQQKLVLTGKFLNLVSSCGLKLDGGDINFSYSTIDSLQDNSLIMKLNNSYNRANQILIKLLFKGYNMRDFLQVLNKYFLLVDNHEFNSFLHTLVTDLRNSKNSLKLSGLIEAYQTAYINDKLITVDQNSRPKIYFQNMINSLVDISVSKSSLFKELSQVLNTRTTDADQILLASNFENLQTTLKRAYGLVDNDQQDDTENNGNKSSVLKIDKSPISRLKIDVEVPFPLSLIVTKTFMTEYQLIFRNLSIIKFIDKSLEFSWKEINSRRSSWGFQFDNPKIIKFVKRTRVLHLKMRNFIKLYLDYINVEVIESHWAEFDALLGNIDNENGEFELKILDEGLKSFLTLIINESLMSKLELFEAAYDLFSFVLSYHQFVISCEKKLVLLDENLFDEYESIYKHLEFDASNVDAIVSRLNKIEKDYNRAFIDKLENLLEALKYYGDIDVPPLLLLNEKLSTAFFEGASSGY